MDGVEIVVNCDYDEERRKSELLRHVTGRIRVVPADAFFII